MKNILFIFIICSFVTCNQSDKKGQNDQTPPVENKFDTPEEAFAQTKKNLHLILTDRMRSSYGLDTDEAIRSLKKSEEVPVSYLPLERLGDSTLTMNDDGFLYGLGNEQETKICVQVNRMEGNWIQSSIGMKKYVNTFRNFPDCKRIVDVPGLQLTFVEVADSSGVKYAPIADYSEADISADRRFSKSELMQSLANYKMYLEEKYGKDFTMGNLDR